MLPIVYSIEWSLQRRHVIWMCSMQLHASRHMHNDIRSRVRSTVVIRKGNFTTLCAFNKKLWNYRPRNSNVNLFMCSNMMHLHLHYTCRWRNAAFSRGMKNWWSMLMNFCLFSILFSFPSAVLACDNRKFNRIYYFIQGKTLFMNFQNCFSCIENHQAKYNNRPLLHKLFWWILINWNQLFSFKGSSEIGLKSHYFLLSFLCYWFIWCCGWIRTTREKGWKVSTDVDKETRFRILFIWNSFDEDSCETEGILTLVKMLRGTCAFLRLPVTGRQRRHTIFSNLRWLCISNMFHRITRCKHPAGWSTNFIRFRCKKKSSRNCLAWCDTCITCIIDRLTFTVYIFREQMCRTWNPRRKEMCRQWWVVASNAIRPISIIILWVCLWHERLMQSKCDIGYSCTCWWWSWKTATRKKSKSKHIVLHSPAHWNRAFNIFNLIFDRLRLFTTLILFVINAGKFKSNYDLLLES